MLSGAIVRLDGETLVIDGVKASDDQTDMEKMQTISLMWSKEAQGFVVTDIMDQ